MLAPQPGLIGAMKIERMGERAAIALGLDREPWRYAGVHHPLLEEAVPSREALGLVFRAWPGMSQVRKMLREAEVSDSPEPRSHVVSVRFDGPDLDSASETLGISRERLVRAFLEVELTVFGLGFQPGFAYLGPISPEIAGLPRLSQPRPRVAAGSVGIAEDQAGIYPCESPGGWNLIGTASDPVVDLHRGWFRFQAGDRVRFQEEG